MSALPVLRRALFFGLLFALGLAIVGAVVGSMAAGGRGIVSGLIGAAMAAVFLAITALSIILASKFDIIAFFGIVMGAWLAKFVVFIVLALLLRDQPWIQPTVLFLTLVVGVIGTLVVDLVVIAKSRMPYVSDIALPGDKTPHSGV
ncbi:MAG: hypothetical protein H7248_09315 [Microbacteriaceae bacterium]|nr:hypothetical protein [Microbacteriaceae bacterium]